MKLKLAFGAVLAATAVVLSGCVVFIGPITAPQQDVIGAMRVTFSICASEVPESPDAMENTMDSHDGCPDHGNSGSGPGDTTSNDDYQLFLGFRVPVGTKGPAVVLGPGLVLALRHALVHRQHPLHACADRERAAACGLRVAGIHLGALHAQRRRRQHPGPASELRG